MLALATLGGCQLGAEIAIVANGAKPRIVVTYDGGKPACVQGLTVTELVGDQRRNVWAIRRQYPLNDAFCMDKFDFAVAPAGYETVVKPNALSSRARYEISAAGVSWSAATPLSVRP